MESRGAGPRPEVQQGEVRREAGRDTINAQEVPPEEQGNLRPGHKSRRGDVPGAGDADPPAVLLRRLHLPWDRGARGRGEWRDRRQHTGLRVAALGAPRCRWDLTIEVRNTRR